MSRGDDVRARSRRAPGCLSDLALDRVVTHEASAQQRAEVQAHVADCARCEARLAAFDAAQRELAATALPLTAAAVGDQQPAIAMRAQAGEVELIVPKRAPLASEPPEPGVGAKSLPLMAALEREHLARAASRPLPRRRTWLRGSAVLATAAGIVLGLRAVLAPPAAHDDVRTKGGEVLGFFVKRGEHVFDGDDGARLTPGDELRFRYTSTRAVWLAVFGVDATNHVSVYFPMRAERTAHVDAGVEQLLPEAVALDDTLGDEQLIGAFCERERALSELVHQLATSAAISGCHVTRLRVTKQVR